MKKKRNSLHLRRFRCPRSLPLLPGYSHVNEYILTFVCSI